MAFALTQHVALSEKLVLTLRGGVGGTLYIKIKISWPYWLKTLTEGNDNIL